MATIVEADLVMRRPQRGFMADQGFFVRYAVVLAVFIIFGFVQFGLRGFADVRTAPLLVHVHGGLMLGWLGIFVAQNLLVHRGELAIHRKLGWASVGIVVLILGTGIAVGYNAVATQRLPPFFSNAYFLALTAIGSIVFASMVAWAITLRRQVQWHRRLMLGAMFILLEPALGRLLPMPLMGNWGEWAILVVQLIFAGVLARHDRKMLGAIHPATKAVAGILVASHVVIEVLARVPAFVAFAEAVAGG